MKPKRSKALTTVYLEPDQLHQLRTKSAQSGVPIAAYVRRGVDLILKGTTSMTKHGEERNHRWERHDGEKIELIDASTGAIVYRGPASSMEETVKEKWCATCEKWIEVRGVLGAIYFMAEHDEKHAPLPSDEDLEKIRETLEEIDS